MTFAGANRILVILQEVFAILALWSTREVFAPFVGRGSRLPPLIIAAFVALSLLFASHFFKPGRRTLGWRILISFVCIVIAGAIAPEFYLLPITILFSVCCSLSLIGLHIEREQDERRIATLGGRIPARWPFAAMGLLVAITLLGLVIFPILPRPMQAGSLFGGAIGRETSIGYQERLELSGRLGFDGASNRQTALRIQLFDQELLDKIVPYRLVRARMLSRFDGRSWSPRRLSAQPARPTSTQSVAYVHRERLMTEVLPSFYGTIVQEVRTGSGSFEARISADGESFHPLSYQTEVNYALHYAPKRSSQRPDPVDAPHATAFKLDARYRMAERWGKFAQNLIPQPKDVPDSLRRIQNYFRDHFAADSEIDAEGAEDASNAENIEKFFFSRRRGHCQLFAVSAGILLGLRGIPTRIATGFRITSPPTRGWLILRQEDAHAWVEAYDPARGWIPLDPTPPQNLSDWFESLKSGRAFRQLRDQLETYWLDRIVSFTRNEGSWFSTDFLSDSTFWSALGILIFGGVALRRLGRTRKKNGAPPLFDRSRNWALRWRRFRCPRPSDEWRALYEELRFSSIDLKSDDGRRKLSLLKELQAPRLKDGASDRPNGVPPGPESPR